MPLFGSKAVTLSQADFVKQVMTSAAYRNYSTKTGSAAAQALALSFFDEQARRLDAEGFWERDKNANRVLAAPSSVKFKADANRKAFTDWFGTAAAEDLLRIEGREAFLVSLTARAGRGELRAGLDRNVVPENSYYSAGPTWSELNVKAKIQAWPPPKTGAGAVSDPSTVAKAKAKAWLTSQKNVGAVALLDKYATSNSSWPLGRDTTTLNAIWKALVSDAPDYRAPNPILPVCYPSSVGGASLLKGIMSGFGGRTVPKRGDPAWEDWALYMFGAIMTSQPFTDGNKRAARAAYAIMVVSGGIDFRAMNGTYGTQLGPMS
jgi:hypothetical protein